MAVAMAIVVFITGNPLSTTFVILSVMFVYLLVFGEIFVNEQYEEKHHGYIFLSTLPLSVREIVAAKFLRVLLSVVLLVGLSVLFISFSSGRTDQILLARSFVLLNGLLALAAAGLAFIGLFGTGYTVFLKIALGVLVLFQLIPFILLSTRKMETFVQRLIDFLPTINWLIVLPVGVALYFGLMLAAIKVKTLRRI
jgi:hypothetical protein